MKKIIKIGAAVLLAATMFAGCKFNKGSEPIAVYGVSATADTGNYTMEMVMNFYANNKVSLRTNHHVIINEGECEYKGNKVTVKLDITETYACSGKYGNADKEKANDPTKDGEYIIGYTKIPNEPVDLKYLESYISECDTDFKANSEARISKAKKDDDGNYIVYYSKGDKDWTYTELTETEPMGAVISDDGTKLTFQSMTLTRK